ncbi:uncharacterized protein EMH_0016580 [Eimeria mitis]|uniref:Uncharacterized protein n=1 Tax=Eimeria mitis TaxID=44415 RepID=U6JTG9_9EIME|nr:uncharacterized protein EMH_0016580 [Eimeria mitis]CDJ28760.1 hypothetical protein, conserved [Eimeria mitis]
MIAWVFGTSEKTHMETEPPMEEAQPAWWLELDRAEAQQKKTEKGCSATQQAGLSSGVQPSRGSGVEGRKVRFASDPAANPNGFYENDAEFVISPAHPKLQTSLTQASEQSEMIAWELSDLDDATDIRRMLIPTVDTPRSSSAGSFSTSSLVDFHCGSHTSVSEPVFRELSDRSVHTASFGV